MAIQVGWGSQWETLANAIHDYYGGGVGYPQYEKVAQMLNSGEYTMEEMEAIIGQIPNFNRTYNAAGQLTGVSYNVSATNPTSAAGSVAQQVNSNVANSTTSQFSTVQNITKDAQTGKVSISQNVTKYTAGTPSTAQAVATNVIGGVMAVSTGISLGKSIDQRLYNANPDFWDSHGMSSLNPEKWATITAGSNTLGATIFNFILGIDQTTNNPQPYIDQDAFAYMVAYMASMGVFNEGGGVEPWEKPDVGATYNVSDLSVTVDQLLNVTEPNLRQLGTKLNENGVSGTGYFVMDGWYRYFFDGTPTFSPATVEVSQVSDYGDGFNARITNLGVTGHCYYVDNMGRFREETSATRYASYLTTATNSYIGGQSLISFGVPAPSIEGITDQEGATQFDASGISDYSDIATVLAALQTQFPDLWDNRIEVSPDGETTKIYIPVGFPTGGTDNQPTSLGGDQADLSPDITGDGDNATDELIKTLIDLIQNPQTSGGMESDTTTPTQPIDPNGDPRGTGETPAIVFPTGSASALWKIYNPSQGQLDTFGAWLWSSNFVDQLLKVFNDPMQAIIGLHKIYATPPTSGSGAIKVGYLTSDASANYVSAQYTEIDCGTVNLKEHFNNVFDYDPFTKVSIFLPFIGFRPLNISDIMRGDITVKYGIDVLTGACLAKISVTRDLNENVLYTFSGNCAVQYPVSSGSYVGIVTGLLGIAGGIAGTIASGGALAPMLMGAGASVGAMHTNVEHSGNISSNAGAMGIKKPYIVIERPQTKIPLYGVDIEGKPQNETVILGNCSGHVRVKAAEYNGFSCTAGELTKIKQLLSSGIII